MLIAEIEESSKRMLDQIADEAKKWSIEINTVKTKIMVVTGKGH